MYLLLMKDIPEHNLEKFGIHQIIKNNDKYFGIRSKRKNRNIVKIIKSECKLVKGGFMKLSELAMCIKYLEILKYKLLTPDFKSKSSSSPPIECFYLNEFPFNSAFCYLFRSKKINKKIDGRYYCCFCPKKPWSHPEWGRSENPDNPNMKASELPHINCTMTNNGNMREVKDIIKEIENIDIIDIMKFLKKITISQEQLYQLSLLWNNHIWQKVTLSKIDTCRRYYKEYYNK